MALPAYRPPLLQQSVDILPAKPTAANLQQRRAAAGWDRQTDRWTVTVPFHRPCSACYAGSAKNTELELCEFYCKIKKYVIQNMSTSICVTLCDLPLLLVLIPSVWQY